MDMQPASPRTEQSLEPYLTEKDVCAYLKVSKRNLFCWRMAGLIPYFKIGRAVRFRKADLDTALGKDAGGVRAQGFRPSDVLGRFPGRGR